MEIRNKINSILIYLKTFLNTKGWPSNLSNKSLRTQVVLVLVKTALNAVDCTFSYLLSNIPGQNIDNCADLKTKSNLIQSSGRRLANETKRKKNLYSNSL